MGVETQISADSGLFHAKAPAHDEQKGGEEHKRHENGAGWNGVLVRCVLLLGGLIAQKLDLSRLRAPKASRVRLRQLRPYDKVGPAPGSPRDKDGYDLYDREEHN